MWTVVYVMSRRSHAEQVKEVLADAGLLAMLKPVNPSSDFHNGPTEILVLESEAEEASQIISELLSTQGGSLIW